MLNSSSASTGYTGASGGNKAGAAARTGALITGVNGSAYFEFTLTPSLGSIALNTISFGSRSTSAGPLAYTLRSSLDNFTADLGTGTFLSNSTWKLFSPSLTSTNSSSPITYRLYGYNQTGSANMPPAYWRIDDLAMGGTISAEASGTSVLGSDVAGAATFAGNVTLGNDVYLTSVSGSNVLFSGAISGASQVNKIGSGTVTLGGANTYTGATNVSAGIWLVGEQSHDFGWRSTSPKPAARWSWSAERQPDGQDAGRKSVTSAPGRSISRTTS